MCGMTLPAPVSQVQALVFDVFGTVTDWRSSVIREGEALGRARGLEVDWGRFADDWRRDGYRGGIERVRRGELPWMNADALHRRELDVLLPRYGIGGLDEREIERFNRVWHRLDPWPDAVPGLTRLRRKYVIAPLSNGGFALLTNLSNARGPALGLHPLRRAGGGLQARPPGVPHGARLLGLECVEVMLVAAHGSDLRGAQAPACGRPSSPAPWSTAPAQRGEPPPDPSFDVVATDFVDLARQLGAGGP